MQNNRIIRTDHDLGNLFHILRKAKRPLTVQWWAGEKRSVDQKSRMWALAKLVGNAIGTPAGEVQNEWKLDIGVPILRARSPELNARFARILDMLIREDQLDAMKLLSCTRLMTTDEMSQFFNAIDQEAAKYE